MDVKVVKAVVWRSFAKNLLVSKRFFPTELQSVGLHFYFKKSSSQLLYCEVCEIVQGGCGRLWTATSEDEAKFFLTLVGTFITGSKWV